MTESVSVLRFVGLLCSTDIRTTTWDLRFQPPTTVETVTVCVAISSWFDGALNSASVSFMLGLPRATAKDCETVPVGSTHLFWIERARTCVTVTTACVALGGGSDSAGTCSALLLTAICIVPRASLLYVVRARLVTPDGCRDVKGLCRTWALL